MGASRGPHRVPLKHARAGVRTAILSGHPLLVRWLTLLGTQRRRRWCWWRRWWPRGRTGWSSRYTSRRRRLRCTQGGGGVYARVPGGRSVARPAAARAPTRATHAVVHREVVGTRRRCTGPVRVVARDTLGADRTAPRAAGRAAPSTLMHERPRLTQAGARGAGDRPAAHGLQGPLAGGPRVVRFADPAAALPVAGSLPRPRPPLGAHAAGRNARGAPPPETGPSAGRPRLHLSSGQARGHAPLASPPPWWHPAGTT